MTVEAFASRADQAQFVFSSPHRSIRAVGVAERIVLPVDPSGQGDAVFQAHVSDALARAAARGAVNPIVIGAIPFDLAQPSCLAVAQHYEDCARVARFPPSAPRIAAAALQARSVPPRARFEQAVRQAVANFEHSDIRKAVLSRILEVELDADADAGHIFARLVAQNARGFHFRMTLPDGAELVGASPELLVRKQHGRVFSNPLAGSAKRSLNAQTDRLAGEALLASSKDAYEHRLVIDEVRRVLAPLCSELDVPAQPSLLGTPAMWHLSTCIEGVPADPSMSALQLACALHPTPAVCGFPTREARKLIHLVEPFDRGLFAGMVGWSDAQGNGEWAVTIRCGRIAQRRVQLFAGAGIVGDSRPDLEWAETEAKLQTMLNALGVRLPALQTELAA